MLKARTSILTPYLRNRYSSTYLAAFHTSQASRSTRNRMKSEQEVIEVSVRGWKSIMMLVRSVHT